MTNVRVKGSVHPSVELARDEERIWVLTPRVQRMIDNGFIDVLEYWEPDTAEEFEEQKEALDDALNAPDRNASGEDWKNYLTQIEVYFDPEEGRTKLLERYDAWLEEQVQADPVDGD